MEKSIYVHILRLAKGHIAPPYKGSDNAWYVIKQGEDGVVELTPAFEGVIQPKNIFDSTLVDTTCEAIGSHIYMIGGTSIASRKRFDPQISNRVHFIDTHRPKDGWRRSCSWRFYPTNGRTVNVDDEWLVFFGVDIVYNHWLPPNTVGYAINVHSMESKWITSHADLDCHPVVATCLFPGTGTVHGFMNSDDDDASLVKLDLKNNTWSLCEGKIPYPPRRFPKCSNVVDDGILYSYDSCTSKFLSYDLRQNEELYVVDFPPDLISFPRYTMVNLIAISKNSFCIVWGCTYSRDQIFINYSRFLVSGDVPEIVLQDTKAVPVDGGSRILNVVAIADGPYLHEASSSNNTMTIDNDDSREGTMTDDLKEEFSDWCLI